MALIVMQDFEHAFNDPEASVRIRQFFDRHLREVEGEISAEPIIARPPR